LLFLDTAHDHDGGDDRQGLHPKPWIHATTDELITDANGNYQYPDSAVSCGRHAVSEASSLDRACVRGLGFTGCTSSSELPLGLLGACSFGSRGFGCRRPLGSLSLSSVHPLHGYIECLHYMSIAIEICSFQILQQRATARNEALKRNTQPYGANQSERGPRCAFQSSVGTCKDVRTQGQSSNGSTCSQQFRTKYIGKRCCRERCFVH